MFNEDFISAFFDINKNYVIKNATDEEILKYKYSLVKVKKKAEYSIKKEREEAKNKGNGQNRKMPEIQFDLDTNDITLSNFTGLDMYHLGYYNRDYELQKEKEKDEVK